MGKGRTQLALCCPCGRPEILALGLCPTCYTLKRQDEEYFGGLREAVLDRDDHRCRGCGTPGREKWSIIVHHWAPRISTMNLMIALSGLSCQGGADEDGSIGDEPAAPGAVAGTTPGRPGETMLAFNTRAPAAQAVPLGFDDPQNERAKRGERT
jgi:hypothetical protein